MSLWKVKKFMSLGGWGQSDRGGEDERWNNLPRVERDK